VDAIVPVEYSIDVKPRSALLGEPIIAVLRCTSKGNTPGVLTFDHKSLVLELDATEFLEPVLAFPNRFAIEEGGKLVRMSLPGGIEDLRDGEERTRTFDLVTRFPGRLLNVCTISFTYRLEELDPPLRPEPVTVEVQSGPETVPLLIDQLNAESSGVRARAAELLRQITARNFNNSADWQAWWAEEGARLPWNYESEGATFGIKPSVPQLMRRGSHLGGIAYPEPHV
jgi:hypothetical protein